MKLASVFFTLWSSPLSEEDAFLRLWSGFYDIQSIICMSFKWQFCSRIRIGESFALDCNRTVQKEYSCIVLSALSMVLCLVRLSVIHLFDSFQPLFFLNFVNFPVLFLNPLPVCCDLWFLYLSLSKGLASLMRILYILNDHLSYQYICTLYLFKESCMM